MSSEVGPYPTPQRESDGSNPPNPVQWQVFVDDPKLLQQPLSQDNAPHSVRTRNGQPNKKAAQVTSNVDTWDFGTDYFDSNLTASSHVRDLVANKILFRALASPTLRRPNQQLNLLDGLVSNAFWEYNMPCLIFEFCASD
ncbi:hypothetical protein HS088_TW13G00055 [Tripterygium wilfordii]|uniref:Uncharacterized protein n=1 Tax=Tripterygium wilfordii TaxID=458696 RepID=A0A7J7CST5_TRIWF|nr:hypothetical protein HS088_TW13G00055 [Tripterygium wilfordii]